MRRPPAPEGMKASLQRLHLSDQLTVRGRRRASCCVSVSACAANSAFSLRIALRWARSSCSRADAASASGCTACNCASVSGRSTSICALRLLELQPCQTCIQLQLRQPKLLALLRQPNRQHTQRHAHHTSPRQNSAESLGNLRQHTASSSSSLANREPFYSLFSIFRYKLQSKSAEKMPLVRQFVTNHSFF